MDLTSLQDSLASSIVKFSKETCNENEKSTSEGQLKCRLELLDNYWAKFQKVNMLLQGEESLKSSMKQLKDIYSLVEEHYIKAKGFMYDEHSQLMRSQFSNSIPFKGNSTRVEEQTEITPKISANNDNTLNLSVPLPRLQIQSFSGKREDWESFRDIFKAVVHDENRLGPVQKFYYLRYFVQGEAKSALDGIATTGTNYELAWNLLKSRYDDKSLLVSDHLSALLSIRHLKEESAQGL